MHIRLSCFDFSDLDVVGDECEIDQVLGGDHVEEGKVLVVDFFSFEVAISGYGQTYLCDYAHAIVNQQVTEEIAQMLIQVRQVHQVKEGL